MIFFLLMYTFCTIAIEIIMLINEAPAALKNGNGIPVHGDTFIVIPASRKHGRA